MIQQISFYDELEQVFDYFPKYWKFCEETLMQNWGQRIFSNWQLGMTVYLGIVMIMVLE